MRAWPPPPITVTFRPYVDTTDYRMLIEHIPAITYIAAFDEASSTIYTSPQIASILGFSQAEWMADHTLWLTQIHPDDQTRLLAELADARRRLAASQDAERSRLARELHDDAVQQLLYIGRVIDQRQHALAEGWASEAEVVTHAVGLEAIRGEVLGVARQLRALIGELHPAGLDEMGLTLMLEAYTVAYSTANGTATAGSDYTSTSGTLTFAPGVGSQTVSVPIINDTSAESTETINLTLSSPSNATLGSPSSATLTIIDDESPPSVGDELYTYDLIGNITSKTGVGSYSYSAAHPHAVTAAGPFGFGYDANGNMTSVGGQITTWDAENRPTSIARQRQRDVCV